jgi:ATP-binding cassette subfamily B protein
MKHSSWKGIACEFRLVARRFWQAWYVIPFRRKAVLTLAAVVIAAVSACNTLMPLSLGRLVDGIQAGRDQGASQWTLYLHTAMFLGAIAAIYIAREGLNVLRRGLVENTCAKLQRDTYVRVLDHLVRADFGAFTNDKVGTVHGRAFRSVDGLIRLTKLGFLEFFPAILTGTFALMAATSKKPILGFIMALVIPTALYLTLRQIMSQRRVRLKLMRSCETIDGSVVELLSGLEYIRAADTSGVELERVRNESQRRMVIEYGHHLKMALFGAAKALNEGLFHVLVLAVAAFLAIRGDISMGDVLMFSILYMNVMAPLNEVHRVLDEGHDASLRVGDLLELLAKPLDPSFKVPKPRIPTVIPRKPVIEVDGLVVEYATSDGRSIRAVDHLSLKIRHGETIGVAGYSGSGKSTWLKAFLRLVHPTSGSIRFGGVPIEAVDRQTIGALVGYVSQNPFVFSGSIAENIAYGTGTPSDDRAAIQAAAKAACLHREIMMMPGGYDAPITERGGNLSGGQRQRLAIARVLLKQPPILILDEATSALDNVNERLIQRSLGFSAVDRTTILVAHRLTTLRNVDRILVFENGRIVETGTYDALVSRGGMFARLVLSGEEGLGTFEDAKSLEVAAV